MAFLDHFLNAAELLLKANQQSRQREVEAERPQRRRTRVNLDKLSFDGPTPEPKKPCCIVKR